MKLLLSIFILCLCFPVLASIYNVTNYGAIGDCQQFTVTCTSNSATVYTTNQLGAGAVGKVMEIFQAGPWGVYTGQQTNGISFPTNHQDLIVYITSVSGTNVGISQVAENSMTNLLCTFGTNNANVIQSVINMAASGDTVYIPTGNYLCIPTNTFNTNYVMINYADAYSAFQISKGGVNFLGDGTNLTVLTGQGAWRLYTPSPTYGTNAARGYIMWLQGPVTNDAPINISGMTFDGGVKSGRTSYDYYPIVTTDGDGWDSTHHAISDHGTAPMFQSVTISNCAFVHWRGEVLIGVVPLTDGWRYITGCWFYDGNASALNFSFSHCYTNNYFDTFKTAEEFYQGYSTQPSFFVNSFITNIAGITGGGQGLVDCGSEVLGINPSYTISGNTIAGCQNGGIFFNPFRNLIVVSNFFNCPNATGVNAGSAGYQGTTNSANITIAWNTFTNTTYPISMNNSGLQGMLVTSNLAVAGSSGEFASGVGWGTNMVFTHNTATNGFTYGLDSRSMSGQWFKDDLSNVFPAASYNDVTGVTNSVTYALGENASAYVNASGAVYALNNSTPLQIPAGAEMANFQFVSGGQTAPLYLNSSMTGTPITMANGNTYGPFYWNKFTGQWQTNSLIQAPPIFYLFYNR